MNGINHYEWILTTMIKINRRVYPIKTHEIPMKFHEHHHCSWKIPILVGEITMKFQEITMKSHKPTIFHGEVLWNHCEITIFLGSSPPRCDMFRPSCRCAIGSLLQRSAEPRGGACQDLSNRRIFCPVIDGLLTSNILYSSRWYIYMIYIQYII